MEINTFEHNQNTYLIGNPNYARHRWTSILEHNMQVLENTTKSDNKIWRSKFPNLPRAYIEKTTCLLLILTFIFSHAQIESISEKVIKEADNAGSGYLTFEEFFDAIKGLDIKGKMAFVSFY